MNPETAYNPDVLLCLANLSNDEVFTPPSVAEDMLDQLPVELWSDPNAKFLDPVSKSGVFLREIAKRLMIGLEVQIPDLQERINHIYKQQLYGIAITELTSLLSRRSLYCSKYANGKYSIVTGFNDELGNVRFNRIEHKWFNDKCVFCGASKAEYDRTGELETHAYELIHTHKPEEIYDMKFDVIIGNPPYQLNDGGGTGSSAIPIYQKFVDQAKKMNPRFLTMITPSRWFTGGRGLDEFRDSMLHDERIREIHDFINASDCFPGVEIKGGVSYFLWDRDNPGLCKVSTHIANEVKSVAERPLLEEGVDSFIRYNELIPILHKVRSKNEHSFADLVSANDPFGFDVRVKNSYKRVKPNLSKQVFDNSVEVYYHGWRKDGVGHIGKPLIKKGNDLIDKYKLYIPKAWGTGDPATDWLNPFIGKPGTCSTETYLVVGPFDDLEQTKNALSYTQTQFFHALVSMVKITQNSMQNIYKFVPTQDFNKKWTDDDLYKKYELTVQQISFIESMIRPKELNK